MSDDARADTTAGAPPAPCTFRFRHRVEVRFRDLDPMGHVHHSLPLVYFEEARAAYWREVAGRTGLDAVDYILAGATLRYHARVHWPARLSVGLRLARLGAKSFTLEYAVCSEDGRLLCSGETTQVMFDYDAGRSVAIPPEVRRRIEAFEAGAGAEPQLSSSPMPTETRPIIAPST